jgi:UDP-2,3-diacylglucosamine pyrophosphatase LpxH
MKKTLVLSDVHLSQAHPEDPADPLWMRYRRAVHHPDKELATLLDHVLGELGADDRIELVFNGDLFDFDSPWVKDGTSSFDEHPPTDAGCTRHMELMLADHPVFCSAVAKLVAKGHEVTFLSGNHDIELYWPGVRNAIRTELVRRAVDEHGATDTDKEEAGDRIRFRSWFHITADRIYFEHGSQYDIHNSVRTAAVPVTLDGREIHPVLGKLAFRRTGARMGYFNPYYEETFYMGLTGYVSHFWKFYARSKDRHIVRLWVKGALLTIKEILRHRHMNERLEEARAAVRKEVGDHLTDDQIDKTHRLRVRPAEETMIPIFRELWVDRVSIVFFIIALTSIVGLVAGSKAALIALGVELALFVLYEVLTPKPDVRTYDSAPDSVLSLLDIHKVRAICMGHTHRPFTRFTEKGLYANSGAWCPAFEDQMCTKPVLDGRPVLILMTEAEDFWGGLYWWRKGVLSADEKNVKGRPSGGRTPGDDSEAHKNERSSTEEVAAE